MTHRLTLAQRSNFVPPVALGYSLWRAQSLTLLSGQPFALRREAALFLRQARPQAGRRWLDIGTSAGFYAALLAQAGAEVVAADLSPAMLREAARRTAGLGISFVKANAEALPLPWAAQFDGVTIGATLNETHSPARLLSEAARVLRPGGGLWLMYLLDTAGPLQRLLTRPAFGGLTFPSPAWVGAQLPGCPLVMGVQYGAVRFEWRVREEGRVHPEPQANPLG